MATRIKICGISRPEDAAYAAQLGVDAIGLVFYAPSPRHVTIAQASEVVELLPPFVTVVGLFVDADADEVRRVMEAVPIDVLQFHGEETPEDCQHIAGVRSYMKAIRMRKGVELAQKAQRYATASALLLDAYQPGVPGGTGEAFEWSRVPPSMDKPIVLAGGLTADNVAEAIRQVRPYAVDISGGVESDHGLKKGIKDQGKMAEFVAAVRAADEKLAG